MPWTAAAALLLVAFAASAKESKKDKKKEAEKPQASAATADVAARIGDHEITLKDVDAKGQALSLKPYQALYDARKAALDALVADWLLETEAKARGITKDALVEQEVTNKVTPVTDEEIQAFYDEKKAQMRGQTLDQAREQIRGFLSAQKTQTATTALLDSLKDKTPVTVLIDAPRVSLNVAADEPVKGAGAVEIVEYSDFQCPFCSRVNATLQKVLTDYDGKVRIVFRDFPLPFHQNAQIAAEAAQCAHEQGKFWEYHDKAFANQQALAADNLKQYAVDLGLDATKFNACLDESRFKQAVTTDHTGGQAVGVSGTPAFFINGRFLSGAQPYEAFSAIIEEELGKSR
jgi:protein-disulfide isomerase